MTTRNEGIRGSFDHMVILGYVAEDARCQHTVDPFRKVIGSYV